MSRTLTCAPLILIVPSAERRGVEFSDLSLSLSYLYANAILAAGGLPWILPITPEPSPAIEAVRRCDGVMLTGGDDVQPKLYRSTVPTRLRRTLGPLCPERDLLEMEVIGEVFRRRKPLLAICRGQQILNVALGGTLLVDIRAERPGALNHARSDRKDQLVHEVELEPDSLLGRLFGRRRIGVNSSHHQAVARVAPPLRITAQGPDGVVEGLELRPQDTRLLPYLLSVQFHPERLVARHAEFRPLFESFIRACAPRMRPSR
ncbi:MAG: gamma-glutamyl-gamma-aminobutyrate hydrolase family protein [Verrucomicrobia bacterium]|nr:gamma-glutamyl-gamma-aminobutyrate hydrolase family protein [Verrucomicrobiota bacterium]